MNMNSAVVSSANPGQLMDDNDCCVAWGLPTARRLDGHNNMYLSLINYSLQERGIV